MIIIKSKREIELITIACSKTRETIEYLEEFIKPGITTRKLDTLAESYINKIGCIPALKNYEGYPSTICASVNDTVVHGVPNDYSLKEGDIISLDLSVSYKGYFGDMAKTYAVGNIDEDKKQLMQYTEESLYKGIEQVKPNNRIGDISNAIERYAKEKKLGIVRELVGHGVGINIHEDPNIPNYGKSGEGPLLKPGMIIAIEPMLTLRKEQIYVEEDDWTIKTKDGSPAAHFEHTVLVTEDGYNILTKR